VSSEGGGGRWQRHRFRGWAVGVVGGDFGHRRSSGGGPAVGDGEVVDRQWVGPASEEERRQRTIPIQRRWSDREVT
jgi:hypothetical protein